MPDTLVALAALVAGVLVTWLVMRSQHVSPAALMGAEARAAAADARAEGFSRELREAEATTELLRSKLEVEQRARAIAETKGQQADVLARRQLEDLAGARTELENAFKSLAADALDSSSRNLLQLAEERFRTLQEQASGELRSRTDALGALVGPLSEKLTEY